MAVSIKISHFVLLGDLTIPCLRLIDEIMKIKCPLRLAVAEARNSKAYPLDVKKFLHGLYATLHLSDGANIGDIEKIIFFSFRNGYVLGAASQGADAQEVQDRMPDFGMDEEGEDAKR